MLVRPCLAYSVCIKVVVGEHGINSLANWNASRTRNSLSPIVKRFTELRGFSWEKEGVEEGMKIVLAASAGWWGADEEEREFSLLPATLENRMWASITMELICKTRAWLPKGPPPRWHPVTHWVQWVDLPGRQACLSGLRAQGWAAPALCMSQGFNVDHTGTFKFSGSHIFKRNRWS